MLLCWNVFFVALTLDEGRQRPPPNNTSGSHRGARTRDTGGPSEVPSTSWEGMDEVNLEEVFLSRTPMLRSCFLRGRFRHSLFVALRERYRAKLVGEKVAEERAWKLFGLVPVMLRHKPRGCGSVVKQELVERANKFGRGQWRELLASLQEVPNHPHPKDEQDTFSQNRNDEVVPRAIVCSKGRCPEPGRSLLEHIGPENQQDPGGVARERPRERVRQIPDEVMASNPTRVNLDTFTFSKCLSSAPSGSALVTGGCTYEVLKVCLGDAEATHLLFQAAEDLARAEAPYETVTRAFMTATMPSGNQTAESAELPPGRPSADWWPRLWPVNSGKRSNQRARHFSSRFPPGQALIASATRSGR